MGKLFRIALYLFGIYIAFNIIKYVAIFILVMIANGSSRNNSERTMQNGIVYSENNIQNKSRVIEKSTDRFSKPKSVSRNSVENSGDITDEPNLENGNYFGLGSSKSEVLQVQGDPTSTENMEPLGMEIWREYKILCVSEIKQQH